MDKRPDLKELQRNCDKIEKTFPELRVKSLIGLVRRGKVFILELYKVQTIRAAKIQGVGDKFFERKKIYRR